VSAAEATANEVPKSEAHQSASQQITEMFTCCNWEQTLLSCPLCCYERTTSQQYQEPLHAPGDHDVCVKRKVVMPSTQSGMVVMNAATWQARPSVMSQTATAPGHASTNTAIPTKRLNVPRIGTIGAPQVEQSVFYWFYCTKELIGIT
jgi:hypothetical protein